MAQLVMDFPAKTDYSAASFYPTQGSEASRNLMQNFERGLLSLWGAPGSGKTHLLEIWARRMGAARQPAGAGNFLALDDVEKLDTAAQEKLFHWLNRTGRYGALVVASRRPVVELENILPDIRSRLSTGQAVEVLPPGENEFKNICRKWAVEKQLKLPDDVLAYVLARAERSVPVLRGIIEHLDRLSLEEKRAITVLLAKKVMGDGR